MPNFSSRSKYLQNVALSLKGHRYVFNEKDSYDDKKGRKARHHHRIKRDINRIKRDVIIASKARHQSHQKRDVSSPKGSEKHTLSSKCALRGSGGRAGCPLVFFCSDETKQKTVNQTIKKRQWEIVRETYNKRITLTREDGDTLGVNGTEVGIFEQLDEVGLGCLLKRGEGVGLEADTRSNDAKFISDLTDETLEGGTTEEKFRRLLVPPDLTKGNCRAAGADDEVSQL